MLYSRPPLAPFTEIKSVTSRFTCVPLLTFKAGPSSSSSLCLTTTDCQPPRQHSSSSTPTDPVSIRVKAPSSALRHGFTISCLSTGSCSINVCKKHFFFFLQQFNCSHRQVAFALFFFFSIHVHIRTIVGSVTPLLSHTVTHVPVLPNPYDNDLSL